MKNDRLEMAITSAVASLNELRILALDIDGASRETLDGDKRWMFEKSPIGRKVHGFKNAIHDLEYYLSKIDEINNK